MNEKFNNKQKKFILLFVIAVSIVGGICMEKFEPKNEFVVTTHIADTDEANPAETIDDSGEKININTASAERLQELPGVGEKLAQRIIEHRKTKGEFEVIQDIMKVTGIGEKKFEAIRELISVE